MATPTNEDVLEIIKQTEKLKLEVEQLKKKSFLTPVQSEAIKAGTDTALYLLQLNYTNSEDCEKNFGIVESFFSPTGPNHGRFACNLGDRDEEPGPIEWYRPDKHGKVCMRFDFDKKKFYRFLKQCTANKRQLYREEHIKPLIVQLDTNITPWLPFMKPYINTKGLMEAIKIAESDTLSDAIYEFAKIQKVVEMEEKQGSAETEQENKAINKPENKTRKIFGDKFEVCGLPIYHKNLWYKIKNWPCVAKIIKAIRNLIECKLKKTEK